MPPGGENFEYFDILVICSSIVFLSTHFTSMKYTNKQYEY